MGWSMGQTRGDGSPERRRVGGADAGGGPGVDSVVAQGGRYQGASVAAAPMGRVGADVFDHAAVVGVADGEIEVGDDAVGGDVEFDATEAGLNAWRDRDQPCIVLWL